MSESTTASDAQWEHAVIHLVWWRSDKIRRLIFGWVELMPVGAPLPANHPFLRKSLPGASNSFVHVARFPTDAASATWWFEKARDGALQLPTHPLKPTPGDGSEVLCGPMVAEPGHDIWILADELPFLPRIHGFAEARGLHGKLSEEVKAGIATEDFEQWFQSHMFFSLRDHPEYQGSLLCVRYDPVVRWVDNGIADLTAADETELYRVKTWPAAARDDLTLSVTQRRPYGITRPIAHHIKRPGQLIEVKWPGKISETASQIADGTGIVHWRSDYTAFLRQIGVNGTATVGMEVIEIRENGKVIDKFSKNKSLGSIGAGSLVGEALKPESFEVSASVARSKREERARLGRYAPTWLEDELEAASLVRAILGGAKQSIWIFDPYFSARGLLRFVLSVQPGSPKVEAFTSAAHLKTKLKHDPSRRVLDGVQSALADLASHKVDIEMRLLPGGVHPIHDRFIVVDEARAWMSGNSLSAIGRRASVLLEVPLSDDLVERLTEVRRNSVSFNEWAARQDVGEVDDENEVDEDGQPLQ